MDILSNFKNINYTNYIELLNLFENDLSDEDKKQPFDKQKIIIESRNDILYSLAIFVMELITKKAELILSRNLKFSRYNAKYLFQNCIKIKELFIKSERDLSRNFELRNRYKICVEKCNEEIKKINANFVVNINQIKESEKLIEIKNINREELLLLLDNYREAFQNIQGINDYETEAKLLANIVKINYKYVVNTNYLELIRLSEQCISLAKATNKKVEQFEWHKEISNILQELSKKFKEIEEYNNQNFEDKCKTENKNIFDKIKKYREKTNIEFIEFIIKNHPPKKIPLKNNQTVRDQWNKDPKGFLEKLSGRYNPDNYKPKQNTYEEKLKFTIMHTISAEINSILSEYTTLS